MGLVEIKEGELMKVMGKVERKYSEDGLVSLLRVCEELVAEVKC